MLTHNEIKIAEEALQAALRKGAQKARLTLTKSVMDLIGTLNGETDKTTHCLDRSLTFCLFVDGRFGSFSTNRFDPAALDAFLDRAVQTVRMLAEDPCRDLPAPERLAKDAIIGTEMGLWDQEYERMDTQKRLSLALGASLFKGDGTPEDIVSEEAEYSDSEFDTLIIDSQGLYCRHLETAFEYGVETTVEDAEGNKYSATWWHSSPTLEGLQIDGCAIESYNRAKRRTGAGKVPGFKGGMVVSRDVASKFVSPLLNALSAYSIQQHNSFLDGKLGEKVFPECLSIIDDPHIKGESGSRLFDSEGVASAQGAVIENGVIKKYFINTYMSRKMGMEATCEDALRPYLKAWPSEGLDEAQMVSRVSRGILVTGFNGGNCNSATGDFSYGIEGFLIEDGRLSKPISEMVVTGNFVSLWNKVISIGNDARRCCTRLVPSLSFKDIDFSG